MRLPDRESIARLRKQYSPGVRVELLHMDDPSAPLTGTKGTVMGVDDIGDLMVNWDNGSHLNVIFGKDRVRKISPGREGD